MSYCNITIGGKERGLKFNQMAILIYQQKVDNDNIVATSGYALIYAGLKANCYVKGHEADFSFENVCDWVDNLDADTLNIVIDCFKETQAYKDGVAFKEDEKKSKSKKKSVMENTPGSV